MLVEDGTQIIDIPRHALILFKEKIEISSKVRFYDIYENEITPSSGKVSYGGYFPYGGTAKLEQHIDEDMILITQIPSQCSKIFLSTASHSDFRMNQSKGYNVTIKNNQNICSLHVGHPSMTLIKTDTEKNSDELKIISIDNTPTNFALSGKNSSEIHFKSSILYHWNTDATHLSNYVHIKTIQEVNSIPLPYHSTSIRVNTILKNTVLLEEDYSPTNSTNEPTQEAIQQTSTIINTPNSVPKTNTYASSPQVKTPTKSRYYDYERDDEYDDDNFFGDIIYQIISTVILLMVFITFIIVIIKCCICCRRKRLHRRNNNIDMNDLDNSIPPIVSNNTQVQNQPQNHQSLNNSYYNVQNQNQQALIPNVQYVQPLYYPQQIYYPQNNPPMNYPYNNVYPNGGVYQYPPLNNPPVVGPLGQKIVQQV
ncbi:hypothetical protein TRFO_24196 [Tritrichomonas foetus]|uniref:Uncharacterized protein n=1 Tax=Tritrichomonas foetus TaxID=1144522 RepID=A0A1J4K9M2_9EUKA|nr:hypothetical protein TRFO_24196 [Tritrichomonas foetus]|eukprot:OHT07616.1 hypothetical protein TRFO_24196 [Tritrichomonas foetus]